MDFRQVPVHAHVRIRIEVVAEGPLRRHGVVVGRDVDERDVPSAKLVFGRLRDRNLPVATAVFAEHVIRKLEGMVTGGTATHRKS